MHTPRSSAGHHTPFRIQRTDDERQRPAAGSEPAAEPGTPASAGTSTPRSAPSSSASGKLWASPGWAPLPSSGLGPRPRQPPATRTRACADPGTSVPRSHPHPHPHPSAPEQRRPLRRSSESCGRHPALSSVGCSCVPHTHFEPRTQGLKLARIVTYSPCISLPRRMYYYSPCKPSASFLCSMGTMVLTI
jgi:hypothetical protein